MTGEFINRVKKDWESIAMEPIIIHTAGNNIYGFGSELAVLRLEHRYGNRSKFKAEFSNSWESWYFRIEL